MKILYICADRGIPILGHKGASVHVRAMVDAFVKLGHDVTIATPRVGKGEQTAGNILHVPLEFFGGDDLAREQQLRDYAATLYDRLAHLTDYDLIYERYSLWSDVGARLAQRNNMPFVLEVNSPLLQEAERYRFLHARDAAAAIEKRQLQSADLITVVSEAMQRYVQSRSADGERTLLLTNAVDPQQFHPVVGGGKVRVRYELDNKQVIGFVGRVRPWHDIETLLAALVHLREMDNRYHLLLVGQTDDSFADRVAELGLAAHVTCTGPIAHQEVPQHIGAFDVAVCSQLADENAYFSPLKLYEYLACGVPTVAADVGQPAQLLTDGVTGYLYRAGDAADLARVIHGRFQEQARARRVAWNAACMVHENYTWSGNAHRVLEAVGVTVAEATKSTLPLYDERLHRRLYRATRVDLALPRLCSSMLTLRPSRICDIEVLKYKPRRRCVLAYTLYGCDKVSGAKTTQKIVGKVFRDERGDQLNQLQQVLYDTGFGDDSSDGVIVARALGYVPRMRMQLQGWARGETLGTLLEQHQPAERLIGLAATAIAKLHNWQPPEYGATLLRNHPLERECALIDEIEVKLAGQSAHYPADGLRQVALRLPQPARLRPVHRDFYYSQLVIDEDDTVTLIDFDLLAWGDAAIDVANFSAHLYLLGLRQHNDADFYQAAHARFCEAYAAQRRVDAEFWQRHAFYEAATLYRLLHIVAKRPHWAHYAKPLRALLEQKLLMPVK